MFCYFVKSGQIKFQLDIGSVKSERYFKMFALVVFPFI
jgi:hypothetical protein